MSLASTTQSEPSIQRPARERKNHTSSLDRESLLNVRSRFHELEDLIGDLGDKISNVASSQEKEFLSAYRVHMLSVQLELKELKLRVAKAEESLQDDGVVSKLEDECNWFRTETLRLQAHATTMESDIHQMLERLSLLREQKCFLSDQLKAVLKRSRVLEMEIDYAKKNMKSRQELLASVQQQEAEEWEQASSRPISTASKHRPDSTGGDEELEDDFFLPRHYGSTGDLHLNMQHQTKARQRLSNAVSTDALISHKQHHNNSTKLYDARKLKSQKQAARSEPLDEVANVHRELEMLLNNTSLVKQELERCIKQEFSSIIHRRAKSVVKSSKNRMVKSSALHVDPASSNVSVSDSESLNTAECEQLLNSQETRYNITGGISRLGLEHFTEMDRRNIMISVLSNKDVFRQVVEHICQG